VLDQLGAVEPEDVQVAGRLVRRQHPVAVPPGLADHQPEPGRLQRRHVVLLAPGVGHRQVDVDDGLGRQSRDGGGTHVLQLQHPPAQRLPDPAGEAVVLPRPAGVGIGHVDAGARPGAGHHPGIGSRGRRGVVERHDLDTAGHQRSLRPRPSAAPGTGNRAPRRDRPQPAPSAPGVPIASENRLVETDRLGTRLPKPQQGPAGGRVRPPGGGHPPASSGVRSAGSVTGLDKARRVPRDRPLPSQSFRWTRRPEVASAPFQGDSEPLLRYPHRNIGLHL
jgi:hypothetical protein